MGGFLFGNQMKQCKQCGNWVSPWVLFPSPPLPEQANSCAMFGAHPNGSYSAGAIMGMFVRFFHPGAENKESWKMKMCARAAWCSSLCSSTQNRCNYSQALQTWQVYKVQNCHGAERNVQFSRRPEREDAAPSVCSGESPLEFGVRKVQANLRGLLFPGRILLLVVPEKVPPGVHPRERPDLWVRQPWKRDPPPVRG